MFCVIQQLSNKGQHAKPCNVPREQTKSSKDSRVKVGSVSASSDTIIHTTRRTWDTSTFQVFETHGIKSMQVNERLL